MSTASFWSTFQNMRFYPSLDRIVETMLGPLNLGPGGGSYNKPISCLHQEGSLALFRTSYKELSQQGIHLSSGVHHLFLKRDKFHSESAGFTLAITCLPHISSS